MKRGILVVLTATRRGVAPLLIVLLLATLAGVARAQRFDGTLRGDVIDESGAVVPDTKITLTNQDTGVSQVTTTTSAGSFVFPNLLAGTYTLAAEKDGFQKYQRQGIQVNSNQTIDANIRLSVGASTTTIEVSAGADLVQTSNSTLTNTFDTRLVADLPNNGGTPLQLALFAPGITSNSAGVQGDGGSVGGVRPRANGFTIDGADDNDVTVTGRTSPVIEDAVADLTVITNQFSAEYGHSAGGLFNLTTKSGTNDVHGTAHWFTQNRNLNAADNLIGDQIAAGLIPNKPRFDHNDLGGTVGGPLVRDKLFFFGAYNYQNTGQLFTGPTNVPPTAAGLGMLNAIATSQGFTEVGKILAQLPVAPSQTDAAPVVDTAGALGPAGATVLVPVGRIQTFATNFANEHDFQTNVDWNHGNQQVRGRFLYSRARAVNLNPQTPQSQFNGAVIADTRKLVVSDVWAITPRYVNDFHVSYSRLVANFAIPSNFINFPNAEVDDLSLNIGPESNSPQGRTTNVYQIADTQTYTRGRHTFKWGAEALRWIAPSNFLPRSRGEWDYANLNELVNDIVPTGSNGALRGAGDGGFDNSQKAFYTFVQDDWKISRRLTLNLGLRYEVSTLAASGASQAINSIADCPECIFPNTPSGLIFRKPKTDFNNFSPRVGFAFDPTGSGKWAIRGGAQVAFDVTFSNVLSNNLPPELQTEQNPDLTCALPGAPAWCASFLNPADGTGKGFLQGGALLAVNVPPTTAADARASTGSLIVDETQPKIITWSLGVQHQLFKNDSLEVRYVGTHGISLPVQIRRNTETAQMVDPTLTNLPVFFKNSDIPATITGVSTRADWAAVQGTQPFAANGFFGLMTAFDPKGFSTYHGVSADYIHRFSHGLSLRYNFTWSHTIDNSTNEFFSSFDNPRRPQDPYNLANERGNSAIDIPRKSALSLVYEIPKVGTESAFGQRVLNGWQINATWLAQDGQPITPQAGSDLNGDGSSTGDRAVVNPSATALRSGTGVHFVCSGAGGATSVSATIAGCGGSAGVVGYVAIDPAAKFVGGSLLGAVSTAGRNSVSTPGFSVVDLGIFKNTYVTEKAHFQFRVEMYNAFNHRNFSLNIPTVLTVLDPGNALVTGYANVTSGSSFLNSHQFSGANRIIQLGLKFIW
ncbi:MAG TPA: TonB-dependent receptor [Candidatus Eisenbacteria bacterium]|nr:TonB-dependent receptor [Candidatus Eisenbacteria bacterium]